MNKRISEINSGLNKVHDVLTKLISSEKYLNGDKIFEEVEEAEELLERLRFELGQISEQCSDRG